MESAEQDIIHEVSHHEIQNQLYYTKFDVWYPKFEKSSLKSIIIPLPQEMLTYFQSDGVFGLKEALPRTSQQDRYDEGEEDWPDEEGDDEDDHGVREFLNSETFIQIKERIEKGILDLDGNIFPKFVWSSPQDANWMMTSGNLKCKKVDEVLLLLKSSDMISQDIDLHHQYAGEWKQNVPHLVLRKWYDLKPCYEFRCFVRNGKLIGISQKDATNFYPFLKEMKAEIIEKMHSFFMTTISSVEFPLSNYVMDTYLSPNKKQVYLIDMNPWLPHLVDSLLFSWEELLDEKVEPTTTIPSQLRIVTSQTGILPSESLRHRLPFDLTDVSSTSAIQEFSFKFSNSEQ